MSLLCQLATDNAHGASSYEDKSGSVYFAEEFFRISSHVVLGLHFVGFMEQVQVTAMTTDWSEVYLSECVCVSQVPMTGKRHDHRFR